MTKTELHMMYKAETSCSVYGVDCYAKVGKYGDVILDNSTLDVSFIEKVRASSEVCLPDEDYVAWLEEKVMELLTK